MCKVEMNLIHKLLHDLMNKYVLPRAKRRNDAIVLDLAAIEVLDKNMY